MNKLSVLASYAYREVLAHPEVTGFAKHLDLIVDSGAFTAFKQGKPVVLEEYCDWLKNPQALNFRYMTLDVIGDPEKSMKNFEVMRKKGLKPIPIFTRGAPPSHLEEYYKHSDLVAIGGIQMKADNAAGYLKHMMGLVGQRKVHWLGYTIRDHMLAWRPASVDSVNWKSAIMYGRMEIFTRGALKSLRRQDVMKHSALLEGMGYDVAELVRPESWKGGASLTHHITAENHLRYTARLSAACGTTFYLGLGNLAEFQALHWAVQRQQGRTP